MIVVEAGHACHSHSFFGEKRDDENFIFIFF
jgi:hypothetical protein